MARYAYDVNTTQRYIDVHKQFQGGLKTVDTDDALGAVFLRNAENISLSEFGFLEKRYGTYENFQANLGSLSNKKLQGYWEFLDKYIIIALDGKLYWQSIDNPESSFTEFSRYLYQDGLDVPNFTDIFGWTITGTENDLEGTFVRAINVSFQKEKNFGAVAVSKVLYVFTGTYPVYIAEVKENDGVTDSLEAFLFVQYTPSFDEIVVAGHNLLEDDYQTLYHDTTFTTNDLVELKLDIEEVSPIYENDKKVYKDEDGNALFDDPYNDYINLKEFKQKPLYSNVEDDILNFKFSYKYANELTRPFDPDSLQNFFNRTSIKSISYRPSGTGATDLSFQELLPDSYRTTGLDNVEENLQDLNFVVTDAYQAGTDFTSDGLTNQNNLQNVVLTSISEDLETAITPNFWQAAVDSPRNTYYGLVLNQKSTETGNFKGFKVKKHTVTAELNVDPDFFYDASTNTINPDNREFVLSLYKTDGPEDRVAVNTEIRKRKVQNFVSNLYNQLDTYDGELRVVQGIDSGPFGSGTEAGDDIPRLVYSRYRLEPVYYQGYLYGYVKNYISTVPVFGAGRHIDYSGNMSFEVIDDYIYVTVTYEEISSNYSTTLFDGTPLVNELVHYKTEDGERKPLKLSYLKYAFPQGEQEQAVRDEILNSEETYIQFIPYNGAGEEMTSVLLPSYSLSSGILSYLEESDAYIVSLPDTFSIPSDVVTVGVRLVAETFTMEEPEANVGGFNADYRAMQIDDVVGQRNFLPPILDAGIYQYISHTLDFFPDDKDYYLYSDFNSLPSFEPLDTELNFDEGGDFLIEGWISAIDEVEAGTYGVDLMEAEIFKGLLGGLYDFKFEVETTRRYYDKELKRAIAFDSTIHNYIVNNVRIIEQDFDGLPGQNNSPIKLHPIWSCNNVIEHYNKLMVWGSDEMPNSLFYSFPDIPEYFPSYFYLDFNNENDDPIVSVAPYMNILVVQTEESTWGVKGNSGLIDAPAPYIPFTISPHMGTIAPKSVRPIRNHLFFLSKQGVVALKSLYAVDEQYNIDFVDRNIRNIVPQDEEAVGIQFDNQYWLNFPNYGITLRWYIDKKSWVLDTYGSHYDKNGNRILKNTDENGNQLFGWYGFNGVFKYQIKNGKLEFITKPSSFKSTDLSVYKIGVDYDLPTDLGSVVPAKMETSFLNQNYPFHPKNYKEAKFDFTLQNEYNKGVSTVYESDGNDDIVDQSEHIISYIDTIVTPKAFIPNHRYQIQYNFSPYLTATVDGNWVGEETYTIEDLNDPASEEFILEGNYWIDITEVQYDGEVLEITKKEADLVEFVLPNDIDPEGSLSIFADFREYADGSVLSDVTYDTDLIFKTWIVSEAQTLNLDNITSYDQAQADLNIALGTKLGEWMFGTSDFGNKVTAVNTIKLSGKGYNSKVYMEDYSKSKWTLESLGITYKMKRARSR